MRFFAFILFVVLSTVSFADRLILIPMGKKLLSGSLRNEYIALSGKDHARGWIGTGIGQSYDFELTMESLNSDRITGSFDMSYNYTVPIVDFAPGISVGFQDALNKTERGRNAYLAITYRFGNVGVHNQDIPTELTFGFWTRKESLIFAGATLPLSISTSLIAEHDSENLTAGFEMTPVKGGTIRLLFREHETLLGFRFFAKL